MSLIGTILSVFMVTSTLACKLDQYGMGLSNERLILETENIIIGRIKLIRPASRKSFGSTYKYDYTMEIVETLKGKNLGKTIDLEGFDGPGSGEIQIGTGKDCSNSGGFQADQKYLIFVNSPHKMNYRPIADGQDPWLTEVREKVKSQNSSVQPPVGKARGK